MSMFPASNPFEDLRSHDKNENKEKISKIKNEHFLLLVRREVEYAS